MGCLCVKFSLLCTSLEDSLESMNQNKTSPECVQNIRLHAVSIRPLNRKSYKPNEVGYTHGADKREILRKTHVKIRSKMKAFWDRGFVQQFSCLRHPQPISECLV